MASEKTRIRVIFAGGGTGGHVYPAVAMHEALVAKLGEDRVDALFVGAKGGLESRILSSAGDSLKLLPGRGVRGASIADKLIAPFDLMRGVVIGVRTIRTFRPDVVVGTGGYASVAMVVAAILTGTPRILQEQNSVPGLVNRRLAKFADLVLLAFTESRSAIPGGADAVVIGNPLRRSPFADRDASAEFFGLDPGRPTVLVIGGSRGAHSLNVAAVEAAGALTEDAASQLILLTGERDYDYVKGALGDVGGRVAVRAYVEEFHHAYAAADVAVARAGASTVFELATYGVPAVLVPYPYAADDHQRLNADSLRKVGGAIVVDDKELTGARLAGEIATLLADETRRSSMQRAMLEWATPDAADVAADRIIELVKKNAVRSAEHSGRPAIGRKRLA